MWIKCPNAFHFPSDIGSYLICLNFVFFSLSERKNSKYRATNDRIGKVGQWENIFDIWLNCVDLQLRESFVVCRRTNKQSGYKRCQAFYLLSDSIRLFIRNVGEQHFAKSWYERCFDKNGFSIVRLPQTANLQFIHTFNALTSNFTANEIHNWVWLIALFNLFLHFSVQMYYIVCEVPIFDTFAKFSSSSKLIVWSKNFIVCSEKPHSFGKGKKTVNLKSWVCVCVELTRENATNELHLKSIFYNCDILLVKLKTIWFEPLKHSIHTPP